MTRSDDAPDAVDTTPIGARVLRSEDDRFLRGETTYVADLRLPELAAAAHVVFVRSTVAHAELGDVSTSAAMNAPGVIAVVTAADHDVLPAGAFGPEYPVAFAQPLLAEQRVRYVGEPIAAVVAETLEAALDAAELVEVDYVPLDAVLDPEQAVADRTVLFAEGSTARRRPGVDNGTGASDNDEATWTPTNTVLEVGWGGHHDERFTTCDVDIELRVDNPRQSPAPIEARALSCLWQDGRLVVWSATQVPHSFRRVLSDLYGLAESDIRVIAGPDVGGGFGGKTSRSPEERALPLLSRLVDRPVTWVETRSEYMVGATQSRSERLWMRLGGTSDGKIEALRVHLLKDTGAYPGVGARLPGPYSGPMAAGPYDIAHVEFSARAVVTNAVQVGAFRGAGRAPLVDALERIVDVYARRIGLDASEVRRRNLITSEQMRYSTPGGGTYDEADYPADLEAALDAAGVDAWREEQRSRNAAGASQRIGIGIGCYLHLTGGPGGEDAEVTIEPDGSATIVTGSTTQGHGHVTTWGQIASQVLGIPLDRINVVEGDTDRINAGQGAVGSRSAQTAGVAIHRASETVVDQAREVAAQLLEAAATDVVLDATNGRFHVAGTPAVSLGWADVAKQVSDSGDELTCGDHFDPEVGVVPSGTHVAVVEIDTETGGVRVVEFTAVDDAGVRINPMIVEGQIHGGIATGIGQALGEAVLYADDGTPLTSNFADYQIVTIDQVPQYRLVATEVATTNNPLGIKAIGESGPIGATAAVHNAVLDALADFGVEHIDIPCTPEKIWRAMAGM